MKHPAHVGSRRSTNSPLTPEQLQAGLQEAAQHRVARRDNEAVSFYTQIEQRNPEALDAPYFLALIDLARDRPFNALPRLQYLSRRLPNEIKVWTALAYTHRELGQWAEALDAMNEIERLAPGEQLPERATALEVLGHIDEAIKVHRRRVANSATRLSGLIGLAHLSPAAISVPEKAEMTMASQALDLDLETKTDLLFAMGEVEEWGGNTDAAFAAFATANRLKRQTLTHAPQAAGPPPIGPQIRAADPDRAARGHGAAIAFRKAVFTPDFMRQYQGNGHHIAAPIFIVGMPRSGSTLLEQILSSHPRVQGLGETRALADTVHGRYPLDLFAPNPPGHFRLMAESYFGAMHARGWGSAPRFVDKMLHNYMDIGLIHLMLPNAVILHSIRNPADICLSAYRKQFESGHETSYDLADIGAEYLRYREMMDHWADVLPNCVAEVSHEALVADPEREIRRLVTDLCGLEWDPSCLRFYETRRAVRTASVAQVRQPIFTSSIERWRRYEKHLGPLFEALGDYAPRTAQVGN